MRSLTPRNEIMRVANVGSVDTWAVTTTPAGLDESWARVHRIASPVVASPAPTARKETAAAAVPPGGDAANSSAAINSAEDLPITSLLGDRRIPTVGESSDRATSPSIESWRYWCTGRGRRTQRLLCYPLDVERRSFTDFGLWARP